MNPNAKDYLNIISELVNLLKNPKDTLSLAEKVFSLSKEYEARVASAQSFLAKEKTLRTELSNKEKEANDALILAQKKTLDNEKEHDVLSAERSEFEQIRTKIKIDRVELDRKMAQFNDAEQKLGQKEATLSKKEQELKGRESFINDKEAEVQRKLQALKDATRGI